MKLRKLISISFYCYNGKFSFINNRSSGDYTKLYSENMTTFELPAFLESGDSHLTLGRIGPDNNQIIVSYLALNQSYDWF